MRLRFIILAFLLAGCARQVEPIVTEMSDPTATSIPTSSPTPTSIPALNPTPIGGGSGQILFTRTSRVDISSYATFENIILHDLTDSTDTSLTRSSDSRVDYFFPACSPSADSVAYTRVQDLKSEIFIMSIQGDSIKKLSSIPLLPSLFHADEYLFDEYPSWAPDGLSIAFSSNRHVMTPVSADREIFTISLIDYEVSQLTDANGSHQHPSWSPDGESIAYMSDADGDWDIYVMAQDGSNQRRITNNNALDRFPAWSPDGRYIAFHSDRDGNLELYITTPDGSEQFRLTRNPALDVTPSWSPDSNWLAFQSDRHGNDQLYMINIHTLETHRLTDNTDDDSVASWCP